MLAVSGAFYSRTRTGMTWDGSAARACASPHGVQSSVEWVVPWCPHASHLRVGVRHRRQA